MVRQTIAEQYYSARKVSAPIVIVRTPDATATIATLADHSAIPDPARKDAKITPGLISHDTVRGLVGLNTPGRDALRNVGNAANLLNVSDALTAAAAFPAQTVLFVHMAHFAWKDAATVQAAWNLRDVFKANFRMVVFLTIEGTRIPPELSGDAVLLTETLPDHEHIGEIIDGLLSENEYPKPTADARKRVIDAATGLTAFAAEQAAAMSLTKDGINDDALWDAKIQSIQQTDGVRVNRGVGGKLDSVVGYANVKSYLSKLVKHFNVVMFIDEIEKGMSGWNSDTSGVSQDFHREMLTEMDDPKVSGVILVGHPGTGKTATATAIGNEAGIPTVVFDMGAMKGKHVGDSEGAIRRAWAVTKAIGQGRVLVIATSNGVAQLSPEIRRRFESTFFFELPSSGELKGMWDQYIARPHPDASGPLSAAQTKARPEDKGWTGAEVRKCCITAWRLGVTLDEAASFVVPISQSMPERIAKLRQEADGAYVSASVPGIFRHTEVDLREVPVVVKRAVAGMRES